MPNPNCTGEEMALHTILDYAEEDFEEDEDYLALPQFANDEDFDLAREALFEDQDVLELFEDDDSGESSENGAEDVAHASSNRKLEFMQKLSDRFELLEVFRGCHFAHIHPEEWFEAFRPAELWLELGICS